MLRADPADTLTMCFWRVTVVRPACWSCLLCRKAKLMGQQDGGHLRGREGVLSSLVHCCSPSSALSRKQDLERNPGLRTRGRWGLLPSSMFPSTQYPPAARSSPVLGTPVASRCEAQCPPYPLNAFLRLLPAETDPTCSAGKDSENNKGNFSKKRHRAWNKEDCF